MEVTLDDPHTVHVLVYEKGILGCFYIDAIGQYAYFDKDGFVVETSSDEIEDVPKITGVTCDEVVLYEKLPLDQPDVLNNLLSLTQILKKYDLLPQEIHYDSSLKPTLTYYGIQVSIGSDDYLSQKIVRLSGQIHRYYFLREFFKKTETSSGHMENYMTILCLTDTFLKNL